MCWAALARAQALPLLQALQSWRMSVSVCMVTFKNKGEAGSWMQSMREQTLPFPSAADLSSVCACTHVKREEQLSQQQRGVTHTIAAVATSGASLRATGIETGVGRTR